MSEGSRVERVLRSNLRTRWVLLALALLLPLALHLLFERQARRLRALAEDGVVGEAEIVRATSEYTFLAYEVGGARYDWNIGRSELPEPVGARVPIVYLPEDPALVRPGTDRACGALEAARSRRFGRRLELGLFAFFGLFFLFGELQIHELRTRGAAVFTDPTLFRRRLALSFAMLAPFLGLLFGYHLEDARAKGESEGPVALGVVVSLTLIGGIFLYCTSAGMALREPLPNLRAFCASSRRSRSRSPRSDSLRGSPALADEHGSAPRLQVRWPDDQPAIVAPRSPTLFPSGGIRGLRRVPRAARRLRQRQEGRSQDRNGQSGGLGSKGGRRRPGRPGQVQGDADPQALLGLEPGGYGQGGVPPLRVDREGQGAERGPAGASEFKMRGTSDNPLYYAKKDGRVISRIEVLPNIEGGGHYVEDVEVCPANE